MKGDTGSLDYSSCRGTWGLGGAGGFSKWGF